MERPISGRKAVVEREPQLASSKMCLIKVFALKGYEPTRSND
ncbi:hypothetical protein [Rhizobium leguminosarum]|nr:hypothetical protein [Rhizobium leguminosarum]